MPDGSGRNIARFFGPFGGKRKSRFEAVPHARAQVAANNGKIVGALLGIVEQNMPALNALRIKCAPHFRNNCIAMVHTTTPNDGRT